MFLEECLNEMNSLLIHFKALGFQIRFHLVQPWSHSFRLRLLPYEKIWQPCLYDNLGRAPTWSNTYNIQTICHLAHDFCNFIVLCHGFIMLHHEDSKGVKEAQKFFDDFVCPFVVYFLLLCFESLVHSRMFRGLFAPFFPLWVHPMELAKNCPHRRTLQRNARPHALVAFHLDQEFINFFYFSWEPWEAFLPTKPCLPQFFPCSGQWGKEFFLGLKLCST